MEKIIKNINNLILFITMQLIFPQNPSLKAQNFKSGKNISKGFFGIDLWTRELGFWEKAFEEFEKDSLKFGFVGFDDLQWNYIEPNPPVNGIHNYDWSFLDQIALLLDKYNLKIELTVRPVSDWATEKKLSEMQGDQCCMMSPLKEDNESDSSNWGITAKQAWFNFIYNLVERYDGDSSNDLKGLSKSILEYIVVGNEPEAFNHFFINGGSVKKYFDILKLSYEAAHHANKDVLIVRGKVNPGNAFDDNPPIDLILNQRNPQGVIDSLTKSFSYGDEYFDLFAINYNDHYTQLPYFHKWLNDEMQNHNINKPFMVTDARTTLYPRDNSSTNHVLPPRYLKDFMEIINDPDDPLYQEYKKILQADEANQSIKKITLAAATNQKSVSLQPLKSPLQIDWAENDKKYMWQYSGLFDPYIYETEGIISKEPVYYALKELQKLLIGAKANSLDITNNIFIAEFSKNDEKFLIIWHEDNFAVDENGLLQRDQVISIDLRKYFNSNKVIHRNFVTELDQNFAPIYPDEKIYSIINIEVNELPIIINEFTATTNIQEDNQNKKLKLKSYSKQFNSTTNVTFTLPSASFVEIKIYNLLGESIRMFGNREMKAGIHDFVINNNEIASGIYIINLNADNINYSQKLLIMK